MKIPLVKNNITKKDINALCKWLKQDEVPRLSYGPLVKEFEEKYAAQQKRKYSLMVNSGSSANLLCAAFLTQSGIKNLRIVVPAVSWATTASPFMELGWELIPCDNARSNLGIDVIELEEIFKEHSPSTLITVNVLGFSNDNEKIKTLCKEYGVFWIMDDCEGCDGELGGKMSSEYGDLVTKSFFISHFMSCVESGSILSDNLNYIDNLKMLRNHGMARDTSKEFREDLEAEHNIEKFNADFTFYVPGYNVRSTEINAFIGLEQLKRVGKFKKKRNQIYKIYSKNIKNDYWKVKPLDSYVSPFAYPIITDKREKLVSALKEAGVETRPLIAGSIPRQPFWNPRPIPELRFADEVHKNGLYLPIRPDLTKEEVLYICKVVNDAIN